MLNKSTRPGFIGVDNAAGDASLGQLPHRVMFKKQKQKFFHCRRLAASGSISASKVAGFVFTIRNCSYDLYTQRRCSFRGVAAVIIIFVIRHAPAKSVS
jgi:hypothetical protein